VRHGVVGLIEFVREARRLAPDIPMQLVEVLLQIASAPGVTMNDLTKRTGLSQASVSRHASALSKFKKLGEPGYDLVEYVPDPRDTRRRLLFLSANGKSFVTRLIRTVDPSFSIDADTDARVQVEKMHDEAAATNVAPPAVTRGKAKPIV
jgi:DNA-binding MarR family transcriptional regulator